MDSELEKYHKINTALDLQVRILIIESFVCFFSQLFLFLIYRNIEFSISRNVFFFQIAELKQKLKAAENESKRSNAEAGRLNNQIVRFQAELETCMQHIQEPKNLASSVRALYKNNCKEVREMQKKKERKKKKGK